MASPLSSDSSSDSDVDSDATPAPIDHARDVRAALATAETAVTELAAAYTRALDRLTPAGQPDVIAALHSDVTTHVIAVRRALVEVERTTNRLVLARDAGASSALCWRCHRPHMPEGDGELLWNYHYARYALVQYREVYSHPFCAKCNNCDQFLLQNDDYTVYSRSLYCLRCVDELPPGHDLDKLHTDAGKRRAEMEAKFAKFVLQVNAEFAARRAVAEAERAAGDRNQTARFAAPPRKKRKLK